MMKKIVKKTGCPALGIALALLLGGCWSYRGINQTTIISGIAIDKDEAAGVYRITYEIVDLTRDIKQTGVQRKIVEAEGKTLFDAARNAKKRLVNKLYFGNTRTIVISQEIAREGIFSVIEWFLRDTGCRETIILVVSQEESAKELLTVKGIDQMLVAYEIRKIVEEDQDITGTTRKVELYDIFNTIKAQGISLTVPAFQSVLNHEDLTAQVNGVGVFKGDKLVGFLNPVETNSYLFVIDEIRAGVLTLSLNGGETDDVSLEIYKNKTDLSCIYEDGRVKAKIKTRTEVSLDELEVPMGPMDEQLIAEIESKAGEKLKSEIMGVIEKVQTEFDSDIFGFGSALYKKDPKTWHQIEAEWDELFRTLDVEIECEILIVNTASLIKN